MQTEKLLVENERLISEIHENLADLMGLIAKVGTVLKVENHTCRRKRDTCILK